MFLLGLLVLLPFQLASAQTGTRRAVLDLNSAPEILRSSRILLPRWREHHQERFTLGGEARLEYDHYDNFEWGSVPDDNNGYFLSRLMLHGDLKVTDKTRVFADIMSALVLDNSNPAELPDRDDFDIHQIFIDHHFGALTARVGRQEMEYGSGKFVSLREGKNVRATFDGLRIITELKPGRLSTFLTRPTNVRPFGLDDEPNYDVAFWGAYFAYPLDERSILDLYYFGINRNQARFDQGTGIEKRHTLGFRLEEEFSDYTAELEAAYQFGKFGSADIRAWTAATSLYHKFKSKLDPRLGLTTAIASGDKNAKDNELNTFYAMFPKGAFFGQIAQNGPSNFISLRPSLDLTISERLSATIDYHMFWRENTHDGVYGIPGNLLRSGQTSRHRFVGTQPGFESTYSFPNHVSVTFFYAHFFAESFLKDTPNGKDIDYLGLRSVYRF